MLSEINQCRRSQCVIPLTRNTQKTYFQKEKADWCLPGVRGRGEWRMTAYEYEVSFGMMKYSKINGGDG